jgi:hypothetical protein
MFLLFAGQTWYPKGGWHDYVGIFPTLETALEAAANSECDWWHIAHNNEIIKKGSRHEIST